MATSVCITTSTIICPARTLLSPLTLLQVTTRTFLALSQLTFTLVRYVKGSHSLEVGQWSCVPGKQVQFDMHRGQLIIGFLSLSIL